MAERSEVIDGASDAARNQGFVLPFACPLTKRQLPYGASECNVWSEPGG